MTSPVGLVSCTGLMSRVSCGHMTLRASMTSSILRTELSAGRRKERQSRRANMQPAELSASICSCPICLDFMHEPVSTSCGHNFCQACYVRLSDARCPCCRAPIASSDAVKPNTLLRELMTSMFPEQTRQAVKRSLPQEVIDNDSGSSDMEEIDEMVEEIFWAPSVVSRGIPRIRLEPETVNVRAPPGQRSVRRRIADNELDGLVRDNPQYSRRAMSQLRAAIQANARQRA